MGEMLKSFAKGIGNLSMEIKKKVAGYVTAGFGVVAGLAWNDAIKGLIEKFFPQDTNTIIAKFVYAFVITLVLVVISIYLVSLLRIEEKDNGKKGK